MKSYRLTAKNCDRIDSNFYLGKSTDAESQGVRIAEEDDNVIVASVGT
jgi:hypothetical protein